jgi:hypothetical protein
MLIVAVRANLPARARSDNEVIPAIGIQVGPRDSGSQLANPMRQQGLPREIVVDRLKMGVLEPG